MSTTTKPDSLTRFGGERGLLVSSWLAETLVQACTALGLLSMLAAVIGLGDDHGDVVALTVVAAMLTGPGIMARRYVRRPRRSNPTHIISGIGVLWLVLVVIGAAVLLVTGTVQRVDDAVVESAAGFTTTSLTVLDGDELSRAMVVWRAGIQWIGGLAAIVVSVVAMPEALRGSALLRSRGGSSGIDLASSPLKGRRRIVRLYGGFTAVVGVAYLASGLSFVDAVVHALSTASTGGWSPNEDSLASYGAATQVVAGIGMTVAGASIFVLWWLVRGRLGPLWRSAEFRFYLLINAVAASILLADVEGLSVGTAVFTAVSVSSTTGFAVGDWTVWSDDAEGVLLVVAAIGSMLGSAGAGFRVVRARLLFGYAGREIRRQLDRQAVVVVKHRGVALDDTALERIAGYQISHLAVAGLGSLMLAVLGVSVIGSIWSATSAVSTLGPSVGEIGSFGSLDGVPRPARLVLVALMLAGRASIVPALALVVWALGRQRRAGRGARRTWRSVTRRIRRGVS